MGEVTPEYEAEWKKWHADRISALTAPHGWIAMASQDWFTDGEPLQVEGIPGAFQLDGDVITYLPGADDTIEIDGVPVTEPTVIPHGFKYSLVKALYQGKKVETIKRTDYDGSDIYGVRVRDPKEAERRSFDDLPTFPLDTRWVVPGRFSRSADEHLQVETIEKGVKEERHVIGTVTFALDGREYTLEVNGRPNDDTGVLEGSVHFTDQTSGNETYGNGRLVPIPDIEADADTIVDFNKAHSFPCAFTNYVTCPLAPARNRLDVAIAAGEKKPATRIERIQTFLKESEPAAV
ncbi:MAG: DUF1684 domain-containing protein [Propionicimonas sp.]|uniref:DUF1684 domain-containing protein n=1 Tax=Propionicimonas sp. TaxID=1955623 RepID=UPI002B203B51|nr:DUF1684 domain-containing protein [Propionicimonas sp.]MEA4944834.1 DUF1684 domain-containing protein [Propionicimonas sp.]MEA5116194.1 DUF1684 domain-containing protein [Propionicimonas sp.]